MLEAVQNDFRPRLVAKWATMQTEDMLRVQSEGIRVAAALQADRRLVFNQHLTRQKAFLTLFKQRELEHDLNISTELARVYVWYQYEQNAVEVYRPEDPDCALFLNEIYQEREWIKNMPFLKRFVFVDIW